MTCEDCDEFSNYDLARLVTENKSMEKEIVKMADKIRELNAELDFHWRKDIK